jgi:ABC-2 type transport system ATP-binding protein
MPFIPTTDNVTAEEGFVSATNPAGFGGNLPAQGSTAPGEARIFDRGYRRYEGERKGVRGAFFTLYLATLQRILGLRRGAKAKILPVLTIGIAYLPAIVVIGISVMFPKRLDRILPDYYEYYGTVITAILLFVAFVAPEALCPDRRYKILGVYLSSPLSRLSYVVAKFAAVFTVLCGVTLGPVLLLVLGKSFLDAGPALVDLPVLLLRVLGHRLHDRPKGFCFCRVRVAHDRDASDWCGSWPSRWWLRRITTIRRAQTWNFGQCGANTEHSRRANLRRNRESDQLRARTYGDGVFCDVVRGVNHFGLAVSQAGGHPMSRKQTPSTTQAAPPDASTPIVLDQVSKWFGPVVAVSDVSFTIGTGITALLGPNGAGKSTVMRLLCGLTNPSSGNVWVYGRNPRTDHGVFGRIGLLPQQESVLEPITAHRFVTVTAQLSGVSSPEAAARDAIAQVELDPDDKRPLAAYSKGMRQRVKLASAIVHKPSLLILDEPLNGLDPRQRARMIEIFHELGTGDRCVVVTSHVLEEVERFGSRIILIAEGRLAAEGEYAEIRTLMEDRPLRIRVGTNNARALASVLVGSPSVRSLSVDGNDLLAEVIDIATFRFALPKLAVQSGVTVHEIIPLDEDLESVFRYLVARRHA